MKSENYPSPILEELKKKSANFRGYFRELPGYLGNFPGRAGKSPIEDEVP